ncbi:unnamed protein product [Musa acuminata subsp. malaccensis]|uniref:(wild Malaysian banana) hypothetical protein n=1 Tax=Musa acuminata subsp. malaccensis TaxID=214687 RepID=A0A804I1T7_MUSAM|nr:unnamed protein product [Musa acuminata subsp. malaccensis]
MEKNLMFHTYFQMHSILFQVSCPKTGTRDWSLRCLRVVLTVSSLITLFHLDRNSTDGWGPFGRGRLVGNVNPWPPSHAAASGQTQSSGLNMEAGRRWEEMQVDCLVNIFRRLALDDLTLSVPFVCKCWWHASLDPSCWRLLDFRSLDFMPWSPFSRSFTSLYRLKTLSFSHFMRLVVDRSRGSAEELIFPLSFGASIQDLVYVSIKCPRLKSLALPDNLMVEDDLRIPDLVGSWRDLEQLEMETKPSSFLRVIAEIGRDCPKFSRLKVRGLIDKEDAKAIVDRLPQLKHLELSKSYLTKDELVVIISGCRKLERLIVRDCLGFQADDEVLRLTSRITRFEHEGSKLLDDYGYETDESEQQTGFFYW